MSYQQTSLFAYADAKKSLGKRQVMVYHAIKENPGIDNLAISNLLGIAINSITPRVQELRKLGRVKEAGKKVSPLTGRKVMTWKTS